MSHVTTVRTEVRDREVLLQVLTRLGIAWQEGKPGWSRLGPIRMDILLGGDRRAGMGFSRSGPDAPYELHEWGEGRRGSGRDRKETILQEYARLKVLKEARRRNYGLVEETRCSGNRIRLVLRKVAG